MNCQKGDHKKNIHVAHVPYKKKISNIKWICWWYFSEYYWFLSIENIHRIQTLFCIRNFNEPKMSYNNIETETTKIRTKFKKNYTKICLNVRCCSCCVHLFILIITSITRRSEYYIMATQWTALTLTTCYLKRFTEKKSHFLATECIRSFDGRNPLGFGHERVLSPKHYFLFVCSCVLFFMQKTVLF